MAGLDDTLAQKEKQKVTAIGQQAARANREQQTQEASTSKVTLIASSSSSSESADESTEEQYQGATGKTPPRKKCKKMPVMSPLLSAALDRTKMSDRKAMMVVTATAQSLGCDIEELALSRSSIRRLRQLHRTEKSQDLRAEFKADVPLTVHWDGKLIRDLTGKELKFRKKTS